MLDALKPLLDSGLVNEATRDAIETAWQTKLKDMQTEIRTEVREEFAGRYEHDKEVMIKTLDKVVEDTLTNEVAKIKAERNEAAKLKISAVKEMRTAAKKFNAFTTRALAEELAEFAQERKNSKSHLEKLERFVMSALAEEINEFSEDKNALRETRVKLIAEAKTQLEALKNKFIQRSSEAVSEIVSKTLNHEISQLHEDIKVARQNNFGRKIFEAFSTEFTSSYLNENKEVKKLKAEKEAAETKLAEAQTVITEKTKLVESKQQDLKRVEDRAKRNNLVSELLAPLTKDKRDVMGELLEGVDTTRLRTAFEKYLPSVLNSKSKPIVTRGEDGREVLKEATGDKTKVVPMTNETDLSEIKRLAGLQ
jgi:hypothetical protein